MDGLSAVASFASPDGGTTSFGNCRSLGATLLGMTATGVMASSALEMIGVGVVMMVSSGGVGTGDIAVNPVDEAVTVSRRDPASLLERCPALLLAVEVCVALDGRAGPHEVAI